MLRLLALARAERMYRVWYWATVDRESDGRFTASIPPSLAIRERRFQHHVQSDGAKEKGGLRRPPFPIFV
jgi:hypothetical protein